MVTFSLMSSTKSPLPVYVPSRSTSSSPEEAAVSAACMVPRPGWTRCCPGASGGDGGDDGDGGDGGGNSGGNGGGSN
eukprot:5648514-Prymnesium_polylepis.1